MSTTPLQVQELDTTAPQQTTATPVETPAATPSQAEIPQFTQADADAYQQMTSMGINPSNAQQFLAAKQALDNLPVLLKQNPDALLDEIEKNDPALHNQLLDKMSDRWYQRWQKNNPQGNGQNGRASSTTVSDPRIDALSQQVSSLVAEKNQEKNARQQEKIVKDFDNSIDSMIAKLPADAALTESEKEYLVLKTKNLAWADSAARDRISKGVYVDVPKHFKAAVERLTADKKQSASTESSRRTDVEARGTKPVTPGAENVNGSVKNEGRDGDDIWGNISEAEVKQAMK